MTERPEDIDPAGRDADSEDDPVIAADGPAEHGPPDDIEADPAYNPQDPDLKRRKGG